MKVKSMPVADTAEGSVPDRGAVASNIVDLIGNTPLLDLSELVGRDAVRLYAKAEHFNPGGSVKDRPALFMVRDAEKRGLLGRGQRILDATSGNTGIAYGLLGAALGYGVTLCVPRNASSERKSLLYAYGAELIFTDPLEGSDGAILEARRMATENAGGYAYLDQYGNEENWQAHFRTTGPEIWSQTSGEITHLVTGLGTSGTFMGVGRFLRERKTGIRLVSVEPESPLHGLEGMKHMATAIVPPIYDPKLADEAVTVATEEAYEMVKKLGREMGLLVGPSSGANLVAALRQAESIDTGVVVTILCDGGDRYLSEGFWEDT